MPQPDTEKAVILVVDDTPENIDVLTGLLGQSCKVKAALSGEKALDIAGQDPPPDLILLDIMMPGMDGYEVCRRLKERDSTSGIPVIFVTAKSEMVDETRGFELGAVDYITKPIRQPVVLARVQAHLELQRARRELEGQNRQLAEQNALIKKYARLRDDVERMTRHDLKTPLNAVLNVPALLADEGNLTPGQMEMLGMLEESGYRMLEIINSSLDLYKMELGKYEPQLTPVDLLKLVTQIRGETKQLLGGKGLAVKVRLNDRPAAAGEALWALGEESLCYSMLANLLKNAAEASPEGERLTVDFHTGPATTIRIHNMGAVPPDIRETFFDKFVTAGKQGGTGLGTYTAGLIAKTLGGTIGMSSGEREGTAITIELPPAMGEDHSPEPPAKKGAAAPILDRKMTILVADDYSNMRRLIKSILRSMGFQRFREAEDGVQAIKILRAEKVGLIISDVNMPNMDGLSLLRNVRSSESTKDIPFLIVSGETDQNLVLHAAKLKVSDYILKPFTPDLLKKKLDAVFH